MQNDKLTLDDILEHRADCHFFLQEPTGTFATEKDIRDNERLAMRYGRPVASYSGNDNETQNEKENKMKYFVEIIEYGTNKVVKTMGPMSERKAERVEDGANIKRRSAV